MEGSPANVCLLSNGRYTVMLTEAGSGYSTCDGIDVARWREDAAESIAALRDIGIPSWRLPDGLDGRTVRVLTSAARLRAIVALATQDDGAAVNLWQADQRSTALKDVDRMARRAMSAAATTLAV